MLASCLARVCLVRYSVYTRGYLGTRNTRVHARVCALLKHALGLAKCFPFIVGETTQSQHLRMTKPVRTMLGSVISG